jgi:hypothetical protein
MFGWRNREAASRRRFSNALLAEALAHPNACVYEIRAGVKRCESRGMMRLLVYGLLVLCLLLFEGCDDDFDTSVMASMIRPPTSAPPS